MLLWWCLLVVKSQRWAVTQFHAILIVAFARSAAQQDVSSPLSQPLSSVGRRKMHSCTQPTSPDLHVLVLVLSGYIHWMTNPTVPAHRFSISNDLKFDAERDLKDIDAATIPVHALNKVSACVHKNERSFFAVMQKMERSKAAAGDRVTVLQIKYGDTATSEGVLFATYSALIGESQAGGQHRTRIKQILDWCKPDFDGVVSFHFPDDAHIPPPLPMCRPRQHTHTRAPAHTYVSLCRLPLTCILLVADYFWWMPQSQECHVDKDGQGGAWSAKQTATGQSGVCQCHRYTRWEAVQRKPPKWNTLVDVWVLLVWKRFFFFSPMRKLSGQHSFTMVSTSVSQSWGLWFECGLGIRAGLDHVTVPVSRY